MSPFIAIAGVIVAFLAFWMQKQANDIIVEQFNKKIEYDEQLDKTKKGRIVELMISDVESVKKDIEARTKAILEFKQEIIDNPYKTRVLARTPVSPYARMSKVDRESLFDALVYCGYSDTIKLLNAFYTIPDYMLPALNQISKIADSFESDVYKGLNLIYDRTSEILKICLDRGWYDVFCIPCFKVFHDSYKSATNPTKEHFYVNMKDAYPLLENEVSELIRECAYPGELRSLSIVQEHLREIILNYLGIEQQSNQIVKSMSDAVSNLNTITERCNFLLTTTKESSV